MLPSAFPRFRLGILRSSFGTVENLFVLLEPFAGVRLPCFSDGDFDFIANMFHDVPRILKRRYQPLMRRLSVGKLRILRKAFVDVVRGFMERSRPILKVGQSDAARSRRPANSLHPGFHVRAPGVLKQVSEHLETGGFGDGGERQEHAGRRLLAPFEALDHFRRDAYALRQLLAAQA
jgi:hypothetical protein